MSYSLQAVHRIVDEWLNAEKGSTSILSQRTEINQQLQKAITEAGNFTFHFMQDASLAINREALNTLVETAMIGCANLSDRLTHYIERSAEMPSADAEVKETIQKLEFILLRQWSWLRDYFPASFNKDIVVPLALAKGEKEKIRQTWEEAKTKLEREGVAPAMIHLVRQPVEATLLSLPSGCTSRQLTYFHSLYSYISSIQAGAIEYNGLTALTNILIQHNFNDPAFINYTLDQFRCSIADMTSADGAIQWNFYLKAVGQIQVSGLGLYLHHTAAKEALMSAIQQEINYTQGKQAALASVYGTDTKASAAISKKGAVLTSLSVSQLAVFCRLFSDCNIVQHSNQTELLKMVAGALQTTRATNISADSLRAKYYSPDRSSIAVVKEHLFRMSRTKKALHRSK